MALYSVSADVFNLVAATAKTAVRINAAATNAVRLRRLIVVDGLAGSADTGGLIRVVTGGTDGSGTAKTPTVLNRAAACDATAKTAYSAEPTASPVEVARMRVPAGGGSDTSWAEDAIRVPASGAIGIELTFPEVRASGIVTVIVIFEEI